MNFTPNPLLYGAHEGFLSTFKIVVTMQDNVDYAILLDVVKLAMKRYPYFCVCPKKDKDSINLQFNELPVPVFNDGRCVVLGTKESNGHLLAFGCEGQRIILHASHYIADGMGISPLLMSVVYLYISKKYGADGINDERILKPNDPVLDEEYAYPFPKPVLIDNETTQKMALAQAYPLDACAFDNQGLYSYHLRIPQRGMMAVANTSDGSPVSFLSVMLFRALCSLDTNLNKPVVAHVQHQYRAALKTPLNRHSLVRYIPVKIPPTISERSVEVQNTIVRGQIILESQQENNLSAVNRLVSVLQDDKALTLPEKQLKMRQYIENSINPKTFGISYVGKMDWCGMERYIEDIHVYIAEENTPNMLLIEVMTIGEDFSINFMQSGKGERYLNAFIEQIKKVGIPVSLVGEEPYALCKTKIL